MIASIVALSAFGAMINEPTGQAEVLKLADNGNSMISMTSVLGELVYVLVSL